MSNPIGWFFAWVSALLALRPSGRHRAIPGVPVPYPAPSRSAVGAVDSPSVTRRPLPPPPDADSPTLELCAVSLALDGELPALVRPYVLADERRQRQRPKSVPRVELICAPREMAMIR